MAEGFAYKFISDFNCTGDKCPDTCCKGWSMQVDKGHVDLYNSKLPELSDFVVEEAGCKVMKRDSETDVCLKLENGFCGIHNKYGETALGDACYFYPRITRNFGGTISQAATISCPEISRLIFYGESPFSIVNRNFERTPEAMKEVLPSGVSYQDYLHIQKNLLEAVESSETSEKAMEKLIASIYSFHLFKPEKWAGGISLFLKSTEGKLPVAEKNAEDLYNILITTYGLIHATHRKTNIRLKEVLERIQDRMGISVNTDSLEVTQDSNKIGGLVFLIDRWSIKAASQLDSILKRWIQSQIIMHSFPFSGIGGDVRMRTVTMIVRYALTRLGLMAYTGLDGSLPKVDEVLKIIQSISRFMDHLGSPELSERLYKDMGWDKESRLRGLVNLG